LILPTTSVTRAKAWFSDRSSKSAKTFAGNASQRLRSASSSARIARQFALQNGSHSAVGVQDAGITPPQCRPNISPAGAAGLPGPAMSRWACSLLRELLRASRSKLLLVRHVLR
jgi:hypothetical protein